jgi:hypothetical protein
MGAMRFCVLISYLEKMTLFITGKMVTDHYFAPIHFCLAIVSLRKYVASPAASPVLSTHHG